MTLENVSKLPYSQMSRQLSYFPRALKVRIKQELTESGVSPMQFISINFEDMSYSHIEPS